MTRQFIRKEFFVEIGLTMDGKKILKFEKLCMKDATDIFPFL